MKTSKKRAAKCRRMTETFSQVPVGFDFYCFGDRWRKLTETKALLNRYIGRPRKKARVFCENEPVRQVRGSDEIRNGRKRDDKGNICEAYETWIFTY